MAAFFQTTTMIISIPSVVILTALFISLWGGSIRFTTPMLFALGFLPMFGIGGLTGLPLGLTVSDIHLHDTYYVIGHFHYVVAPGTIFALFAGIYYWFPKATGRKMNETLGKIHFCRLVRVHERDLHADVHHGPGRRVAAAVRRRRVLRTRAAGACTGTSSRRGARGSLALFQIPFIFNFFWSICSGEKVGRQPVAGDHARVGGAVAAAARQLPRAAAGATAAPTSTAFPARPQDFVAAGARPVTHRMEIPYTVEARPRHRPQQRQARHLAVPGLRGDAVRRAVRHLHPAARRARRTGRTAPRYLNIPLATLNTVVLIGSSVTMVMAWASLVRNDFKKFRVYMAITILFGFGFLIVKYFEYSPKFHHGLSPRPTPSSPSTSRSRPAHAARDRRDGGQQLPLGARREALEDQPASSRTGSRTRACSGTSSTSSGSSCSRSCTCSRRPIA